MIIHLFNSSLVSGPETLAIPAFFDLQRELQTEIEVWNLAETRKNEAAKTPLAYAHSFGLKTFEITIQSRFDKNAIRTLANELERAKPSIVHAHDVKASIYLALAHFQLKLKNKDAITWKLVTTHHGIHARNGAQVRLYELLYRFFFLPFFDRTLVVCSSDRTILLHQGLSPKKVLTHLNGVNRTKIEPEERVSTHEKILSKWKSDLGYSFDAKLVLGVAARLSPEKNHALLIDALEILKTKNPNFICLCFGMGALEAELKAKTTSKNLDDVIKWCGYRKNLSDEMPGFDLLVSLSVGEGLPINLLEAGWAGTPIFATRVDGVNDLVPAELPDLQASGIQAHPSAHQVAERLNQLIQNRKDLNDLGLAFQARVEEHFSGASWKNRLKEIYRTLVARF